MKAEQMTLGAPLEQSELLGVRLPLHQTARRLTLVRRGGRSTIRLSAATLPIVDSKTDRSSKGHISPRRRCPSSSGNSSDTMLRRGRVDMLGYGSRRAEEVLG